MDQKRELSEIIMNAFLEESAGPINQNEIITPAGKEQKTPLDINKLCEFCSILERFDLTESQIQTICKLLQNGLDNMDGNKLIPAGHSRQIIENYILQLQQKMQKVKRS